MTAPWEPWSLFTSLNRLMVVVVFLLYPLLQTYLFILYSGVGLGGGHFPENLEKMTVVFSVQRQRKCAFKRMLRLPFRLGSEQDALEIRDYQGYYCVCVAAGGGEGHLQGSYPQHHKDVRFLFAAEAAALAAIRTSPPRG